jgi:hypothetical protein
VFGSVPESSGCSLRPLSLPGDEVDNARVDPCRGCFMGSFLDSDVFPRGSEVDGLAYPLHWPKIHSYQSRGQGLPVRHCPVLSLFIGGGSYLEEEASQGIVIRWRVCPLQYLCYRILHMVNGFYQVVLIP